jgi:hypothetical protein
MSFKAAYNKDIRFLLKEEGTETLSVEKTTDTTNAAVQVAKYKCAVDGVAADGHGQYISWYCHNDADTPELEEVARLVVEMTDVSNGTEDSCFKFYTKNAGTLANRLTVDTSGSLSGVGDMTFAAAQSVNMIDNNADAWAVKDATANEYLVFDTSTGALRIELNQNVKVANNMDILAATVGGSDLGGTSNEWGSVYLASGKGVYFGSAQECNLLEASGALQLNMKDDVAEAFSIQTESGASEYLVITTSNGSETVTLGCSTADESAQNTTVQAGNDLVLKCGTTAADTIKLQAYDIDGPAYRDIITIASHAADPTLTLAASGGITVSNATAFSSTIAASGNITMAAGIDILCTDTNSDLGSTTSEWGNIFVGASKGISFGAGQEASIKAGAAGQLDVAIYDAKASAFTIKEGTNSYLTITTTDDAELVTLATVQDMVINAGATATDTLKLQAYDGAVATAMVTLTSHATLPTLTLTSQGALTIQNVTAASAGVNIAGPDNSATAITLKEDTNSYVTIDTRTGAEKITISSEQDTVINCGLTATDSVKLQAYDIDGGAYVDMITLASHATDPTMTLAATGGIAINNNVTMAAGIDILCTNTSSDLGSTGSEWGNIYVGDSKGVSFGADQDQTLVHDGTAGLDLTIADNDAGAFVVKQGANAYLTFVTTNDAESVTFGKLVKEPVQTVDMANAKHTLVYGTAGANQSQIVANLMICDPNGGDQILVLPTEASSTGVKITMTNSADAAESITIKDDAEGYTVCVIAQNEHAIFWCNGTTWYGGVMQET